MKHLSFVIGTHVYFFILFPGSYSLGTRLMFIFLYLVSGGKWYLNKM